ncbi:MAG TPA: hypothetical protein VN977_04935, partial [Candidatus Binatia bacterium]|nr:hypothetical protein [Candidatus Binatia bacterium]
GSEPPSFFPPSDSARELIEGADDHIGAHAELLFVSSNAWDVAGAKAFGYQVAWCNRTSAPEEELGVRPDVVVPTLDLLPR